MPGDDQAPRLTVPSLLRRTCLGALLGAGGPGCRAAEPAPALPAGPEPRREAVRSGGTAPIGTATMLDDGTILLRLRAETAGAVGDALLRYAPADPRYATVRDHLPALRPGMTLAVPPFE